MKLSIIHRKELPVTEWNEHIVKYSAGRPYAMTTYLDCITHGRWEAIVADDFQWVMPLPYNRKIFGLKQYYQPFFCQQLGVIGSVMPDIATQKIIRQMIRKRVVRAYLQLNESNTDLVQMYKSMRQNLVLPLGDTYEEIRKRYRPELRSKLRKSNLDFKVESSTDGELFFKLFSLFSLSKVKENINSKGLIQLIHTVISTGLGEINYLYVNEKPIAGHLILKNEHRIINLMPFSDAAHLPLNGQAHLVDHLIQVYAGTATLLDFEGSDNAGIAQFFKSFGAVNLPYPVLGYY